ncbi:MAG: hypothetical protein ACKOPR_02490 [Chakrabartia godavariana]
MRVLPILAALVPMMAVPAPASAQRAERVLVIFGNDPCPTDSSGSEIVVCARRPETERYRIPKEVRPRSQAPQNQSWAARSQSVMSTGRTGTDSCSAVGAGGWTGCWAEQMRAAKAEAKQKAADERDVP